MLISGQFHVDPESLSPQVKWGQKVLQSENGPSHDRWVRPSYYDGNISIGNIVRLYILLRYTSGVFSRIELFYNAFQVKETKNYSWTKQWWKVCQNFVCAITLIMKKIGHMVENYIMVSFHKNCYKSISFNDIYLVGFL